MPDRGSVLYPTAELPDASKDRQAGRAVPELIRWIVADYDFAHKMRRDREAEWETYWKLYLSEKRRADIAGRSNAVGPHGGLTIRGLVPLIKRSILATRPFIRALTNKRELTDMVQLLEKRMDYWIDAAGVRTVVLTHMLKEGLIFGCCWGKVQHVVRDRPVVLREPGIDGQGNIVVEKSPSAEVIYEGPEAIYIPTEDAFPYPMARDLGELERGGYFIHRFFKTKSELADDILYDPDQVAKIGEEVHPGLSSQIPLDRIFDERRRRILGMTVNQFNDKAEAMRERGDEPVEVMELIANGQLYTLANRAVLIREVNLDHPMPLFSLCPDPIPGEIFGKSVFHDARSPMDQRDFLINNIYDNLARLVHSTMKGIPGMYDSNTTMPRPGGVVHVRDMGALEPMDQHDIVNSAFAMLTHIDRDIERGTGLNEVLSAIGSGAGTVYPETATVGAQKQENSLMFVGEMISNLEEEGLKRMARIFFDIEKEFLSRESWVALAGEEGARWRDVDPDTLARDIDWQVIGSSYAATREAQAAAVTQAFDRMIVVKQIEPDSIDLRELASTFLEAWGVPNRDRIVRGEPVDVGPEAEHETMRQGLPVKPEAGENLQGHVQAHLLELQRVTDTEGEDPGYIERLLEHLSLTRDMISRVQQAQAVLEAEAQDGAVPTGLGGNGGPGEGAGGGQGGGSP